jgi:hypothetical protein
VAPPQDSDAAPPDDQAETQIAAAPRKRGGLFGGRRNAAGVDAPDTGPGVGTPGSPLAFGQIVQACGVNRRDLGREVAKSPGSGQYRLYDTNPTSVLPRTQYLTGFKDGCARRFTASLALFGAPDVHEAKRYDTRNSSAYSGVDTAYEKVKNRVCGVRRGQPCPASKASRLAREAAFLTVYRGFGDSGVWLEIFMHKGRLEAFETRSR